MTEQCPHTEQEARMLCDGCFLIENDSEAAAEALPILTRHPEKICARCGAVTHCVAVVGHQEHRETMQ